MQKNAAGQGASESGRECSGPEQSDCNNVDTVIVDIVACAQCRAVVVEGRGIQVSSVERVPVRIGTSIGSRVQHVTKVFCTYACMLVFAQRATGAVQP